MDTFDHPAPKDGKEEGPASFTWPINNPLDWGLAFTTYTTARVHYHLLRHYSPLGPGSWRLNMAQYNWAFRQAAAVNRGTKGSRISVWQPLSQVTLVSLLSLGHHHPPSHHQANTRLKCWRLEDAGTRASATAKHAGSCINAWYARTQVTWLGTATSSAQQGEVIQHSGLNSPGVQEKLNHSHCTTAARPSPPTGHTHRQIQLGLPPSSSSESWDQRQPDIRLAALVTGNSGQLAQPGPPPSPFTPPSKRPPQVLETCRRWNQGECHSKTCWFLHKCLVCQNAGHMARDCHIVCPARGGDPTHWA